MAKTTKKTTKKTTPATKKVAAKKATAKKTVAKKPATKKLVAKKATAKKSVAKKPATKKVVAKKATAKKSSVKTAPAKKPAPEKKQSAAVVKAPTLNPGDLALDFTLLDQNGKEVSLREFRGRNVVVYFYPKAMTPGCTVQACELRNSEGKLRDADIVVLGISADPVKSLKKFEEKENLNFTLLSDPEKTVIKSYGAWGPKKFMGREFDGILRQSFLIDKEGKIVHVMHKVDTKTHHDDVLSFFKNR
jgi:peroxiredoxin Q/BCP